MNILALETCFGKFSVAIFSHNLEVAYTENTETNMQAEQLVPAIEQTLRNASLNYSDLNLILCCAGPGSFTGLRIGIAAAHAISLALGIKAFGVSSLAASAQIAGGGKIYLPSGHKDAFYQEFSSNLQPLSEPELILGFNNNFSPLPNALAVGKFYFATNASQPLEPIYTRKPDAKLPNKKSPQA